MEERVARGLAAVTNFEGLATFETNVRRQNAMTNEVAEGIKACSAHLGRAFIKERAGIDLSNLTPAEERIVEAVSKYVGVMKRQGKIPTRTLSQLRNRGLIGAAEAAVSKSKPTQGFQVLKDENLEALSYEQIILDYPEEFSERARWFAGRRLNRHIDGSRPPARAGIFTLAGGDLPERALPNSEDIACRTRNPDWTYEEHVLGLDLYMRLRGTSYPDEHPEVLRLSETLHALAMLRGMSGTSTFRNANGVSMKMLNFRRLDPSYSGVGLPSGGKLEEAVWDEYVDRREDLGAAVTAILKEIDEVDHQ